MHLQQLNTILHQFLHHSHPTTRCCCCYSAVILRSPPRRQRHRVQSVRCTMDTGAKQLGGTVYVDLLQCSLARGPRFSPAALVIVSPSCSLRSEHMSPFPFFCFSDTDVVIECRRIDLCWSVTCHVQSDAVTQLTHQHANDIKTSLNISITVLDQAEGGQ